MTDASDSDLNPESVITRCQADLAANLPAEGVLSRLRALEGRLPAAAIVRARFLSARAVAANRLGFPTQALGDLYEARHLLEGEAHHAALAEIDRTVALVYSWRGDGREAALALLRSVAEALAGDDSAAMALALIEAGRVEIEIGRPVDAQRFLAAALRSHGERISKIEKARASVNLVQACVLAGRFGEAAAHLVAVEALLAAAPPRLRFLAALESARIAQSSGDLAAAGEALDRASRLVPSDEVAFEHIEIAHVKSEVALAEGNAALADALIRDVVSRYATDDLVSREVVARLLQAKVFDALDRRDEAERTLLAALRRALARGLYGHADEVRARLAARGSGDRWLVRFGIGIPEDTDAGRRFVRRQSLGAGSGGTVSRAYDLELGIEVALKRIRLEGVYDTAARSRRFDEVSTEVAAAARVEHPGVARIHGLLTDTNGDLLLVEELIDGPTLRAVMSAPLKRHDALGLLSRISFALAAIHSAGIVHRDIKPDNIVLRGGNSPVIVDFGIAVTGQHRRGFVSKGTKGYAAPEQQQHRPITEKADLYALGVVAHELLLGTLPPPETRPLAAIAERWRRPRRCSTLVAAGIDPSSADLVAHLLAPHPASRPSSAALVGARFAEANAQSLKTRTE